MKEESTYRHTGTGGEHLEARGAAVFGFARRSAHRGSLELFRVGGGAAKVL